MNAISLPPDDPFSLQGFQSPVERSPAQIELPGKLGVAFHLRLRAVSQKPQSQPVKLPILSLRNWMR